MVSTRLLIMETGVAYVQVAKIASEKSTIVHTVAIDGPAAAGEETLDKEF